MICKNCQASVERGRVLCPSCGEPLGAAIALAVSETAAAAPGEMAAQPATMQLPAVRIEAPKSEVTEPADPSEAPEPLESAEPAQPPRAPPPPAAAPAERRPPPPRIPAPRPKGPPERPLRVGEEIAGRYQVQAAAGSATFGAHYHLREAGTGTLLSLWTARADERGARAVLALGPALQRLEHRNIARSVALLRDRERLFAITELVEGESLAEHLARRSSGAGLPLRSAVNVVLQLAAAIGHAHAVTAHGALGLDAVMVLPSGRLKIVGFGLGLLGGGDLAALRASDLRGLSVMLYELLTGAEWAPEALPAGRLRPDVPLAVDAVLQRALGGGVGSVTELHDGLAAAVGAKPLAPEPSPATSAAAETRWMVVKGHLDYGPFSIPQLLREIAEGRLGAETVLKNVVTGDRRPLSRFPELAEMLREHERRVAAEKARFAEEQKSRRRRTRRTWRMVLNFALVLAVAAGVTVFLASRMKTPDVVRNVPRFQVEPASSAQAQVSIPTVLIKSAAEEEPEPGRRRRRKAAVRTEPAPSAVTPTQTAPAGGPVPAPEPEPPPPPAEVDFSESDPTQVAARESAKDAVRQSSGRLRPCFNREAQRTPALRGKFTVSFTVSGVGRTYGIRVRGDRTPPTLEACIRATIASISFPKFTGLPLQVEYPFTISTE